MLLRMHEDPEREPDLFLPQEDRLESFAPLAERIRPQDFGDFLGQDEIVAPGRPLRRAIETDTLSSLIL